MEATTEQFNHISEIINMISFRKFGNAFRKNIDEYFKCEYNTIAVGGYACTSFPWSEVTCCIIGDHSYRMTKTQYHNFCNTLSIKPK